MSATISTARVVLPTRIGMEAAAAMLGISPRELRRLRQSRKIPFYRISHRTVTYSVTELEAFLQARHVEAVA